MLLEECRYFVFNSPLNHFDNRNILGHSPRRAQDFWTEKMWFLITAEERLHACSISSMKRNTLLCFRLVLFVAVHCLNFRQQKKEYFPYVISVQKENLYHKLYSWYCVKIKHDKIVWKDSEIAVGSDHIRCAEQEPQCTHAEHMHFLWVLGKVEVTVFFPRNQEIPKYFLLIPHFFLNCQPQVPCNGRKQGLNIGVIFQLTHLPTLSHRIILPISFKAQISDCQISRVKLSFLYVCATSCIVGSQSVFWALQH